MSTLSEALAPRSDQLNADELIAGPRTLKLTGGKITSDGRQQRMTLSYEGDNGKPFKPCKTMGRAMVMLWKLTDEGFTEQVKGKSVRVYRDPEVTFGAEGQVGGIRISHVSHIEKATSVKLTVSQGKKAIFTFHPMPTDASANRSDQAATETTIDDARDAIANAATLDDLKRVWLMKIMAPFRDELKAEMEERKAALAAFDDPATPQTPAQTRETLLMRIAAADDDATLTEIDGDFQASGLEGSDRDRVAEALEAARGRVS